MHSTTVLAATMNNPISGWVNQWNAGWHSTPAASVQNSASDTGLIMLVLVVLIVAAIWGGLKKMAG